MNQPQPPITCYTSSVLTSMHGISHGFFGRKGGVSTGLYHGLNCGVGSGDNADAVLTNRQKAVQHLGLQGSEQLCTVRQCHSNIVVTVKEPFGIKPLHDADALVTNIPNIALGILTADCVPLLFYDPKAHVIGATHSGWKGAISGIAQHTIEAMVAIGAHAEDITCAVGPCIKQASYEVDTAFFERFEHRDKHNSAFFVPSENNGRFLFDLTAYVVQQLESQKIGAIDVIDEDTYANQENLFSYRRSCHHNEPNYGRQISLIALAG